MKIFLDTAGIDEIRTAARWGVLDGVTTNPSSSPRSGAAMTTSSARSARSRPGLSARRWSPTTSRACSARAATSPQLAPNIFVKVPDE